MPCRAPLEAARLRGEKPVIFKRGRRPKTLQDGYEELELPCGRCVSCRLEKSRQWGVRLACEMTYLWEELNQGSVFITLTYDEQHLPIDRSLVPEHLQLFIKKLREHVARKHNGQLIRHFSAGEYGSQCQLHELENCPKCGPIQRPHYHSIILGYQFPDRRYQGDREGFPVYQSEELEKIWGKGRTEITTANFQTAAYTAGYILKKQTGKNVDEGHYTTYCPLRDNWYEVLPEFAHMSTQPGIGMPWLGIYWDDVYKNDQMPIPGRGLYGVAPDYFDKLAEKWGYVNMEQIKQNRSAKMAESIANGPSMESRAIVQDAKMSKLQRQL
ncbi:replication initiator protein [Microviridae sp.]|nr:replication initiator protein [Microviridae sp.]